ncbi:NOP protein chaperone 1-like [Macrobrachium nipponense]|uniref:NOP protein chaperone 1-like n=1 Tax=Macrobrachium nipponense TaxID=159736 RepID=UPI0030C829B9
MPTKDSSTRFVTDRRMAEKKSDSSATTSAAKAISKELLSVTGDGSSRSVVETLLKKQPPVPKGDGPKTFKVARSPLLDELQSFLPAIQKSNQQLLDQTSEEIDALDIENIDEDDKIIEMNVILGEMSTGDDESSDSELDDSEDIPVMGPVTEENLRIPSEARGGRRQGTNLITEVTGTTVESEDDRSDGELTVASSNSAER